MPGKHSWALSPVPVRLEEANNFKLPALTFTVLSEMKQDKLHQCRPRKTVSSSLYLLNKKGLKEKYTFKTFSN